MKLKFYMRGLGIGMIVTAMILGFTNGNDQKDISNEEIKKRASQLGMVENMVLSDYAEQNARKEEETTSESESVSDDHAENAESRESEADDDVTDPDSLIEDAVTDGEGVTYSESAADSERMADNDNNRAADSNKAADSDSAAASDSKKTEAAEVMNKTEGSESSADMEEQNSIDAGETQTVSITIKSGDSSVRVSKTLEAAGLVADAGEYDTYLCTNGHDKKLRSGHYEIPVGASEEEIAKIITSRN